VVEKQKVYYSDDSQAVSARPSGKGGLEALRSKISLKLYMNNPCLTNRDQSLFILNKRIISIFVGNE
jgi:hypothetical protein